MLDLVSPAAPATQRRPSRDLGGFVLRDGTKLSDLIDLERREVSMRVLSDPEIFDLEMQRIFARAWQPVAHESEIPKSGDFVVRYLGKDSVIVTRDRKGDVHVVLNACTHRGMRICRSEAGHSGRFVCPYHGWVFGQDGEFIATPVGEELMHGDIHSKAELSLQKARVEIFCGMVFANFDETAHSLAEHLGPLKTYYELMFNVADQGFEVLGPPQRFRIQTNWKCAGEQHAGDGFHVLTLHKSLLDLFRAQKDAEGADLARGLNVNWNGHGLRCVDLQRGIGANMDKDTDTPMDRLRNRPPGGLSPEQVEKLPEMFTPEELYVLAFHPPQVGGMFPHVGTFTTPAPLPNGTMSWKVAWHAFVPRGPGQIEFYNWLMVPKGCSQEVREQISRASVMAFGTSGFIETDDADVWPSMYDAAEGYYGAQGKLRYGALIGDNKPEDWPLGGHIHPGISKDDNQWAWWRRWAEFMGGDPYGPNARDQWPETAR